MYRPGIDVAVVDYRTPHDLDGFLASLPDSRGGDLYTLHVGIVDPEDLGPYRSAIQFVEDHPDASGRWWWHNIGYGGAANALAAAGDREVIAIFNADVRVEGLRLFDCYQALVDHDDWGILGPRQVDERGRIIHAGIFGTNTAPTMRGWMSHAHESYEDIRDDAVSVMGSAYFIKRKLWDELKLCDGDTGAFLTTPLYYEETWCSYHARAHGAKVVYYGRSTMVHKWHQSINQRGHAWSVNRLKESREIFREVCAGHGIECD